MNRFFLILIITALSLLCPSTTRALTPQYQRADSIKVVTLLAKAAKQPAGTNYMIYFARQLRGIPYVAHTLEVNPTERLVVNLRQLDCTTYVENVCALTLCMQQKQYTFDSFCRNLQTLRYRDGRIDGYASRLHYFTQWIEDNTRLGIVKETQSDRAPFNATQTIDVYYMSKNPNSYKMLRGQDSLIKVIAQQEKEINGRQYRYITKTAIYNNKVTRRTIADGDTPLKMGNGGSGYESMFSYQKVASLEEVYIGRPIEITSGNKDLFYCCNIKKVTVGSSVTEIPDGWFHWCSSLQQFTASDKLKRIGNKSFQLCKELTSFKADGLEEIGEDAFTQCEKLSTVALSPKLTTIGASAFYGTTALTELTIPASVTSIGEGAFKYSGLKKLTFADGDQILQMGKGGSGNESMFSYRKVEYLEELHGGARWLVLPVHRFRGGYFGQERHPYRQQSLQELRDVELLCRLPHYKKHW